MPSLITTSEAVELIPGLANAPGLAGLVDAASALVEAYCRREFAQDAATVETLNGRGTPTVFLSRPPVNSITSVEIDDEELDNTDGGAWKVIDSRTGVLSRGNGRGHIKFRPCWPAGAANVTVTYDGGFAEIPPAVKLAVAIQAQYLLSGTKATGKFMNERLGDYSYTLPVVDPKVNIAPTAAQMLDPYVLHGVGVSA